MTLTARRVRRREADAETVTFGIRSLRLDPEHGLRINGETVKLRGACVHHDNGVLGAATFARAEERRVQILKDAGFNAIRMAHHPMSRAMLNACDRLGMLVMDEAFDVWTSAKSDFDYSLNFPQWWERDIEAMVAKDVNHPSVIALLDRQRDPRDRVARRGGLGTQARGEGPRPRHHPLRHQRDQRHARRARRPGRHARPSRARTPASTP